MGATSILTFPLTRGKGSSHTAIAGVPGGETIAGTGFSMG